MIKTRFLLLLLLLFLLFNSCKRIESLFVKYHDGFDILIEYIETEKDYINGREIPFFIIASDVYKNMDNNYLIIDIRSYDDYKQAHISNSINIDINQLIYFFENKINPEDYEKIVIVCNTGGHSGFVTMGLLYLGYKNVFPLRNGLSSWNKVIANNYWKNGISNILSAKLETSPNFKNTPSNFPNLPTKHEIGYDILRERIIKLFSKDINSFFIEINDIIDNPEEYYIVSYWPSSRYDRGHIPLSIQYTPKYSLRSENYLNTLPTDKLIVLQCYSGNHTAFVTMFLSVLGYNVKNLMYGANSFMYNILQSEERPGVYFTDREILNFPLVSKN